MLKGGKSALLFMVFLESKIKLKEGEFVNNEGVLERPIKFKLRKANLWLMKRACSENKQIQSWDKQLTKTKTSEKL